MDGNKVSYKMLTFKYNCGNVPSGVSVGTTSDYNLLARWTCPSCEQECIAFMLLEKLIAGVPSPPSPPAEFTEEDRAFLSGGHVLLEGGET